MKLTTLNQSQKLRAWGAPQEGAERYWHNSGVAGEEWVTYFHHAYEKSKQRPDEHEQYVAAYDLESLIEWLQSERPFMEEEDEQSYLMLSIDTFPPTTHPNPAWQAGYIGILMGHGSTPLAAVFSLAEAIHGGKE